MALTLETKNESSVSLDEYVDYIERSVNLNDLESIISSAAVFRGLLNDRTLVSSVLNDQLRDWRDFQIGNNYTAQTFLLALGPSFIVRANIWTAPGADDELNAAEKQNFYYAVAHDHNFTFMTGGYLGSGYKTTLWEYDQAQISGRQGEKVDFQFIEETTLPQGKIMVYRKGVDVHSQGPAADFSISINLMAITDDTVLDRSNQYIFDMESQTVKETLSSASGRVMLTNLARYVGDQTTVSLLDDLLSVHPDERVRATAAESLCLLCPSARADVAERMSIDQHAYVRAAAAAVGAEVGLPAPSFASLI